MKRVVIPVFAEGEIDLAAAWHEERREGLGQQFYDRVLEAIERIEENPVGYAKVYRDARKIQLRQFHDWALWFKIMPDNSLIIACLSSKRNPKLGLERALGVIPFPEP